MKKVIYSITGLGLVGLLAGACSGSDAPEDTGGNGNTSGTGGGSSGAGGAKGGSGNSTGGSSAGTSPGAGTSGSTSAGSAGAPPATGGSSAGTSPAGGAAGSTGGTPPSGGSAGTSTAGTDAGGGSGTAGTGGTDVVPVDLPELVTTAPGANDNWNITGTLTDSTAASTVTVNATMELQTWEGFGGSFNEAGWDFLTSDAMKTEAIKLLFSATDGANLLWGRIPMGASDYARKKGTNSAVTQSRYTLDSASSTADPTANGEGARPAADTALASFSLERDKELLIPYIKAAQAQKAGIKFWASPWTPPSWMKTGYKTDSGGTGGGDAMRPSYFDGGTMKSDTAILQAYAQYYVKFVNGYKDEGITIEYVSPQNEPGYDQNYPSCLWEAGTYATFVASHLGPAMDPLGVKIMLGTLSNAGDAGRDDVALANTILQNATAKAFFKVVGVQWGVLDKVNQGTTFQGLPIWATEHKCGNYPWMTDTYKSDKAPNDAAYGKESWDYIKNAIKQGKVTAYNAWNMVLDADGRGNDTSRHWMQNALLVADGGMVKPTPYYYVFRHMSQYVVPGAKVVGVTGGDAVAWKNPDGSVVTVLYNSGGANPNYVVEALGKKKQFAMPASAYATVVIKP